MTKENKTIENAELYRKAYLEWYPQWSDAKAQAQVARVQSKSSAELFEEYAALLAFGRAINAQVHPIAIEQQARAWDEYYARIQTFEKKRRAARRNASRSAARRNSRT